MNLDAILREDQANHAETRAHLAPQVRTIEPRRTTRTVETDPESAALLPMIPTRDLAEIIESHFALLRGRNGDTVHRCGRFALFVSTFGTETSLTIETR